MIGYFTEIFKYKITTTFFFFGITENFELKLVAEASSGFLYAIVSFNQLPRIVGEVVLISY